MPGGHAIGQGAGTGHVSIKGIYPLLGLPEGTVRFYPPAVGLIVQI